MVEREHLGVDRRHVDRVDTRHDDGAFWRNIAGAGDAAPELARGGKRPIVGSREQRDPAADALDLARQKLERIAIHVWRCKDHLRNLHALRRGPAHVTQHRQQELIAHAVRDDADRLCTGLPDDKVQKFTEIGLRRSGALPIVAVVLYAQGPFRWPTVNEWRAIELQVVGHLRGAKHGELEARIEAGHDHERVVLVGDRFSQSLADELEELEAAKLANFLDREVLFGSSSSCQMTILVKGM